MPLYLTASHSSRVHKPSSQSAVKRSSSTPFAALSRTKALQKTKLLVDAIDQDDNDQSAVRLDATGKILPTVSVANVRDVPAAVSYATSTMFCPMPERAGMNSIRTAEVLNFQRDLPPVVSIAHVHALISASSRTEREIAVLLAQNKVRKIKITGRGNDISGLGEVLISTDAYVSLLRNSGLESVIVDDFVAVLRANPRAVSFSPMSMPLSHSTALTRSGFLVSSSISGSAGAVMGAGASVVATPSISRAASGTWGAVGGDAAFERLGGTGGARRRNAAPHKSNGSNESMLSIPNIGPYLRLLSAGRSHLIALLGKSQYREAPLYLLRERWDGAVDSNSRVSQAKQIRGEFSSILPGRTKKWKDLYGMNFDWALEECLGAGLIELFETHSVGLGVRALE